jgi:hypothetical protein
MPGRASASSCSYYSKARREKKEKRVDPVIAVRPTNAEEERIKFFSQEIENYEPQFLYSISTQLLQKTLQRHHAQVQVERRYVPHALRILNNLLQKYGSYDRYEEHCGGHEVTIEEAKPIVHQYLVDLGAENELTVVFDPNLVARASFIKGVGRLNIRPQGLRRNWIQGMLHHEVGTHFLRDKNDKNQCWAREKNGRRRYRLEDKNPTEEGLASLHTVLEREGHCLFRVALLYYATWRALSLSFRDLYEDLGQFLGTSNDERWDYCVRAKRGLLDTSQPGGFAKDQHYLIGAMEILEQRRKIDFVSLYAGKISVLDSHRVRSTGLAKMEHLSLPIFLQGSEQRARYIEKLDEIVHDNDLSDLVDRGGVQTPGPRSTAIVSSALTVNLSAPPPRQQSAPAPPRTRRLSLDRLDFSFVPAADKGTKAATSLPDPGGILCIPAGLSLNLASTFSFGSSGCRIGCGCCTPPPRKDSLNGHSTAATTTTSIQQPQPPPRAFENQTPMIGASCRSPMRLRNVTIGAVALPPVTFGGASYEK